MDILDLETSLQFANYNGVGLNVEQRFQLQNGIQTLLNSASKHDFEELLFWGRIEGVKNDYYIALGVTYSDKYQFPEKRFYWASSTDFKFHAFPSVNDQHYEVFDSVSGMFSGDSNKILINVQPPKDAGQDNDGGAPPDSNAAPVTDAAEPKVKDPLASTEEEDPSANFEPRNLTEMDRLVFTVYAIENDCHIIPKGSFKLTDQHEIRRNNAFKGLAIADAVMPNCYMHFRAVQDHIKAAGLEKDECVFRSDFLDEASIQKTHGALSALKVSTKGNIALIRNHVWPGFATYHVADTQTHGNFYFGEGQKNLDLSFQL